MVDRCEYYCKNRFRFFPYYVAVPYPGFNGSRIHEGFYTAWKRMESQVYSLMNTILASRCPTCTHVVTTGHRCVARSTYLLRRLLHSQLIILTDCID